MRFVFATRFVIVSVILSGVFSGGSAAELAFQPAGDGYFQFDTGVLRGKIRCDGKSQGIPTMIHVPSGKELAWGDPNPGILSYYRILGRDWRYDDSPRHWPARGKLLSNGALAISWAPGEEHPFELAAVYHWAAPDVLDVDTICMPQRPMPDAEVFLSSYFCPGAETVVYVGKSLYGQGKPGFLAADYCPLLEGTYLFFPRDREASRLIYDRRWEFPPNPVQWSVTQRLAAPMAMRRATQGGPSVLLMSPPEDCFAIAVSYNRTPPDGVASHRSIYFSLFGRDLKPGEPARARMRMVVGDLTPEKAEELYAQYREQLKTAGERPRPPRRVLPPAIDAAVAGRAAMAEFDANKDGKVAGDELQKAPSLRDAIGNLDVNRDGAVSADEVTARVEKWQASRVGLMAISCRVLYRGKPLEGATVVFEPEKFLGTNIKTGEGTTDANGMVSPKVPGSPLPGIAPGLYLVRITSDRAKLPPTYNEQTVLGLEVSMDAKDTEAGIVFNVK